MFLVYGFGTDADDGHLHGDHKQGEHQDESHPLFQEEANHQQQDAHHGRRHRIGNKKSEVRLQVVTYFGHVECAGSGVELILL